MTGIESLSWKWYNPSLRFLPHPRLDSFSFTGKTRDSYLTAILHLCTHTGPIDCQLFDRQPRLNTVVQMI